MIKNFINRIGDELTNTFKEVDRWFDASEKLLNYNPSNAGWKVKEVLEHITLTNYFLLILIKKGARKALELSKETDFETLLGNYDVDWEKLHHIGEHKSFEWNRPAHMEPTGTEELLVIRNRLRTQLDECNGCLTDLKNGEGVLYKTTMTVNGLGKIDVYHYIYFFAEHAKRHLIQMEKIKIEYGQNK